jgi:formate--tetrahydrofolate ligase
VRRITWKRVVDMNDRALREITVGLGGTGQRLPARGRLRHRGGLRGDGHPVPGHVAADLKERLGRIVVGYTTRQEAGARRDLKAHGAMAVLLKDALAPNLVQTLENNPACCTAGPSPTSRTAATR